MFSGSGLIRRLQPRNTITVPSHVFNLEWSPSGSCFVVVAEDACVRVLDARMRLRPTVLREHTGSVNVARFMGEHTLATGSDDTTVKWWDLRRNACVKTFRGHSGWVKNVDLVDQHTMLTASFDGTLRVWDVREHYDARPGVQFDGDGLRWTSPAPARAANVVLRADNLRRTALSPDARTLAVAAERSVVLIRNLDLPTLLTDLTPRGLAALLRSPALSERATAAALSDVGSDAATGPRTPVAAAGSPYRGRAARPRSRSRRAEDLASDASQPSTGASSRGDGDHTGDHGDGDRAGARVPAGATPSSAADDPSSARARARARTPSAASDGSARETRARGGWPGAALASSAELHAAARHRLRIPPEAPPVAVPPPRHSSVAATAPVPSVPPDASADGAAALPAARAPPASWRDTIPLLRAARSCVDGGAAAGNRSGDGDDAEAGRDFASGALIASLARAVGCPAPVPACHFTLMRALSAGGVPGGMDSASDGSVGSALSDYSRSPPSSAPSSPLGPTLPLPPHAPAHTSPRAPLVVMGALAQGPSGPQEPPPPLRVLPPPAAPTSPVRPAAAVPSARFSFLAPRACCAVRNRVEVLQEPGEGFTSSMQIDPTGQFLLTRRSVHWLHGGAVDTDVTCVFDLSAPSPLPAVPRGEATPAGFGGDGVVDVGLLSADPVSLWPRALISLNTDSSLQPDFIKGPSFDGTGRFVASPYYGGVRVFAFHSFVRGLDPNPVRAHFQRAQPPPALPLSNAVLGAHEGAVLSCRFHPHQPLLAIGGMGGAVSVLAPQIW